MAVKKNVVLILIIFIFLFSIQAMVVRADLTGCCLAPFDNNYDQYYLTGISDASGCYGSFQWVDNCFDVLGSGQLTSLVDDFEKGCCCNDITQEPASFGDSAFETQIFKPYCDSLNDGTGDTFTFQSPVGGSCECGQGSSTQTFFNVSGHVTRLVGGAPISGIVIQLLDDSGNEIMRTTSESGEFSFTSLPPGQSTFHAFSPSDHELSCISDQKDLTITSTITDLDFVLQCEDNLAACQPSWYTGAWGECVPYTVNGVTTLVRFRDVHDENNCSTSIGQPTNVNTTSCEGEVSFGDCGNGQLDGFEQCDYDANTGSVVFKDLNSQDPISGTLSCGDFYFLPADQAIGCTHTCTYDTSMCTPACDDVCDRLSECGTCPSCDGNYEVCGNPCDQTKPVFLNEFEKTSTRNILDLYSAKEANPDSYSSQNIKYFEGTKDVELTWSFNDSCLGNILAFEASVCEEDSSTPNHCGSGEKVQGITTDLADRSLRLSNVFEPGKTYCYNVAAISLDGANKNWAYNETDDLPCFSVGSEYCMTPDHEQGLNCISESADVEPAPMGCVDASGNTNLSLIPGDCLGNVGFVGEGDICVETEYDLSQSLMGAECRQKSTCSLCNGLFGLYADHNLKSFYFQEGQENPITNFDCNGFLHLSTDGSYSAPAFGLCYLDSTSSVDKFDECSKVTSCYDYNSQDACENDYCNKFTNEDVNDCEWSEYNNELGIGVCKPKDTTQEDCFRCDSNSPLGFCDETMCGLYGDCYFKEIENHANSKESQVIQNFKPEILHDQNPLYPSSPYTSTCVHQRDMGCYFYDTQENCEGANGPASFDVLYETNFGTFQRPLFGTNTQLTYSNDTFGFGDCFWNNDVASDYYGCNKNSDGFYNSPLEGGPFYLDDCEYPSLGEGFNTGYISDPLRCRMDNESPSTNLTLRDPTHQDQYISQFVQTAGEYLPVYGKNELADILYDTNDTMESSDEIATYFSFVSLDDCTGCIPYQDIDSSASLSEMQACYDRGCELYPQHPLKEFRTQNLKDEVLHNGEHLMIYYSEDSAHNLEVVHYKPIFIDAQGPEFTGANNLTYDVKSFLLDQEDVYASNLTIAFSINEPALCTGTLTLGTKEHPVGDILSYDTEFSTFYPWLPDGYYNFNVDCFDDYQNELSEDFEITVEGDKSITNPQPRGGVFTTINDINLSIETAHNATCHLSSVRQPFSVSPLLFSNVNEVLENGHSGQSVPYTDGQFNALDISGTHVYFTSCDFGQGNITEMKNGDTISFTIDQEAPRTSIYASTTGKNYQSYDESLSEWSPVRYIKLMCSDDNTLTPVDNFKCKEIHYCLGEAISANQTFDPNVNCLPINGQRYMSVQSGDELELQDLRQEQYSNAILYYYSTDKGGNEEELQRVNIRLRDVEFEEPMFEWVISN